MSSGFRQEGSHSTLGLVRETAKVVPGTDASENRAEALEPPFLHNIGPVAAKKQSVAYQRARPYRSILLRTAVDHLFDHLSVEVQGVSRRSTGLRKNRNRLSTGLYG
jgi:hypothetical protein